MNPLVVVDASVAVQACIEAEGFTPLSAYTLAAPAILTSEVLSTLHELTWRREISSELARLALARLHDAPLRIHQPDRYMDAAWQSADELGWAKTYDAEYVALARLLDCPLVTLDARMARSAGRIARVVGPAEL